MTLSSFNKFQGGQQGTSRQIRDQKLSIGKHLVRIDQVTAEVAKRYGGFILIKMTHLAATEEPNTEFIPRKWLIGGATRPGTEVTYKIWESSEGFGGELVTMLCNLTGCDENDVTEDVLKRLVSEEQPLAGFVCEIEIEHRYRKSELDEQGNPKPGNDGGYTRGYWWRSFGEEDGDYVRSVVGDEVYEKYVAETNN